MLVLGDDDDDDKEELEEDGGDTMNINEISDCLDST